MIRHSSSFLISLLFHLLLVAIVFYTYKQVIHSSPNEKEKRVKILLCSLPQTKPEVKKPKVIKKKALPKKKVIVKKTLPVKKAPKIIKEIPKKVETPELNTTKEIQIEEVIKIKKEIPKIIEEPIIKELEKEEKVQETAISKKISLEKEYFNAHIQKITQLLSENLYYPRSARKRNIQGNVMVKFKLSTSAKAYDIEVTSSKSEILSRAAIRTIENLSGDFPAPSEELLLHVPISYKLSR